MSSTTGAAVYSFPTSNRAFSGDLASEAPPRLESVPVAVRDALDSRRADRLRSLTDDPRAPLSALALRLALANRGEREGSVATYAPDEIARLALWPGDPLAFTEALYVSGIVDEHGFFFGWAANEGRAMDRLLADRARQRERYEATKAKREARRQRDRTYSQRRRDKAKADATEREILSTAGVTVEPGETSCFPPPILGGRRRADANRRQPTTLAFKRENLRSIILRRRTAQGFPPPRRIQIQKERERKFGPICRLAP